MRKGKNQSAEVFCKAHIDPEQDLLVENIETGVDLVLDIDFRLFDKLFDLTGDLIKHDDTILLRIFHFRYLCEEIGHKS